MLNLIRSFFYAVALLTLFWISQQPADQVTLENWVRGVQTPELQQVSFVLALAIFAMEDIVWGVLAAPGVVVGYTLRKAKQRRIRTPGTDNWSFLD